MPPERVKLDTKSHLPSNPPRKSEVFGTDLHSAAEAYRLMELGGSTEEAPTVEEAPRRGVPPQRVKTILRDTYLQIS